MQVSERNKKDGKSKGEKNTANHESSTRDDETRIIGRKKDRADKGRLVVLVVPLLSVVEVGEVLAEDEGNVEVINPEMEGENVGDEGDDEELTGDVLGVAGVGVE